MIRLAFKHHHVLQKISFYSGLIGFAFFAQGLYDAALIVRIVTELCRLPAFTVARMKDQVRLCWLVLGGCVYGLVRSHA